MIVEGVADEALILAGLLLSLLGFILYVLLAPKYHQVGQVQADLSDHDCPICVSDIDFGVQTNCNHYYCGDCFFDYYEYKGQQLECCLCRTNVNFVQEFFTEEELRQAENQGTPEHTIMDKINRYNTLFGNQPRSFLQRLRDTPYFIGRMFRDLHSFGAIGIIRNIRFIRGTVALVKLTLTLLAGLLYVVSPFDIVSEAAFGLVGLVDDIAAIVFMVVYVAIIYRLVLLGLAQRQARQG